MARYQRNRRTVSPASPAGIRFAPPSNLGAASTGTSLEMQFCAPNRLPTVGTNEPPYELIESTEFYTADPTRWRVNRGTVWEIPTGVGLDDSGILEIECAGPTAAGTQLLYDGLDGGLNAAIGFKLPAFYLEAIA